MKTIKVLIPCVLLAAVVCNAQTASEISNEDLKKYAITMDSVDALQNSLRELIAERVRSNDVMPVERYNELFKIIDDAEKLRATNATEEEIAFVREIDDLRKLNVDRINDVYQGMARDYVGAKVFNTIHKSLESDEQLKSRYEAIAEEITDSDADKGG